MKCYNECSDYALITFEVEAMLRAGMILFGCFTIPIVCFWQILTDADPMFVTTSKVELSICETLFGSLAKPRHCFG